MSNKSNKLSIEKVRKKVGKAIEKYHLINNGDYVLVAVSGGIDSLAMIEILANRRPVIPVNFRLEAIHIKVPDLPDYANIDHLIKFHQYLNIPLHIREIKAGASVPREGKSKCFVCAWHRRKLIFQAMNDFNANKLAMGHHMDDILETLLMNMINHGEFSSIPPKLLINKGNFNIIRPLSLLIKSELNKYARLLNIEKMEADCPFAKDNKREEYKDLLRTIQTLNKKARLNLYKSMTNINKKHLPEI